MRILKKGDRNFPRLFTALLKIKGRAVAGPAFCNQLNRIVDLFLDSRLYRAVHG